MKTYLFYNLFDRKRIRILFFASALAVNMCTVIVLVTCNLFNFTKNTPKYFKSYKNLGKTLIRNYMWAYLKSANKMTLTTKMK